MQSIDIIALAVVDCTPLSDRSYSKLVVLMYVSRMFTDLFTGSARLHFEHVTPVRDQSPRDSRFGTHSTILAIVQSQ